MKKSPWMATALVCAGFGFAASTEKPAPAAPKASGNMTMMDMADRSSMRCMAMHDSLESLSKTVQEALKSDDKAKMKAALQRADAHFSEMKDHMSNCVEMMDRMGGMMGGGMGHGHMGHGMGMGPMMHDADKAPAEEKKDAPPEKARAK